MITKRKIELNNPTDAAIVPAIVGSGIAILLSLISIAVEKAQLPGLLFLTLVGSGRESFLPDDAYLDLYAGVVGVWNRVRPWPDCGPRAGIRSPGGLGDVRQILSRE
jgi:hypothetical protein